MLRVRLVAWGLLFIIPILSSDLIWAQEYSVRPGANRYYQNPDFSQWVARFERPGREIFDRRFDIVNAVNLTQGMRVADVGAGTGLFTRLFADKVGPDGRVYAVDISRVFVENILRINKEQNINNVVGVVNTPKNVSLSPASVDLIFICDTYYHFEHPFDMMKSVREALRPGGSVVVIDFRKIPRFSSPWVMGHVRADRNQTIHEIEQIGFKLSESRDLLQSNFFLRFEKI